jgi:hypothetical protein
MPENLDTVAQQLIDDITKNSDDQDKTALAVKTLKTFAEAQDLLTPDPEPDPEPTGWKAFLDRHSGELIKITGTAAIVLLIAVSEAKGDIIFRSKASKFI